MSLHTSNKGKRAQAKFFFFRNHDDKDAKKTNPDLASSTQTSGSFVVLFVRLFVHV